MSIKHKTALRKVQWALQEAYPMAVKLRGIQDWSLFRGEGKEKAEREVEEYQIKIARMILQEVNEEFLKNDHS